VRRREGGEKTSNKRKAHAQLRSFKKNQRAFKKKRRCARARATKERERERERENNHTHHHGRILRRGGPPSAVHVFLYGKFLSKTLIF